MRKKLGEMLVAEGLLTESGLRAALAEQKRWGGSLGRTLVEMRQISEELLVQVLSRQLGIEAVDLDKLPTPSAHVLALVPGDLAQNYSIVPFQQVMKFLDIAMADPTNLGIVDELRIRTQLNIRHFLAGPKMIERAIAKYYNRGFSAIHSRADMKIPEDLMHGSLDLSSPGPRAGTAPPHPEELTFSDPPPAMPRTATRTGAATMPAATAPPPAGLARTMAGAANARSSTPASGAPIADGNLRPAPRTTYSPVSATPRGAEIDALQERISHLEALVHRDEEVLRKLLGLLVEKGIATRDEILVRLG